MRLLRGARLTVFAVGLNSLAVGAVFVGGFLLLRYPNTRSWGSDPALRDLTYDVPHWLLGTGVTLCVAGCACALVAWTTSPGWTGEPLGRGWGVAVLSPVLLGWGAAVVVAVLGRRSGEIDLWAAATFGAPVVVLGGVLWDRLRSR